MRPICRDIVDKITKLLEQFPVIAIIGARQAGKTALAKQLLPEWKYFDLENPEDFERISGDPSFFFSQYPKQVIIDEAQEHPEIFRVLRGVIDKCRAQKGRFLLTGSSSPELINHISESLAGRIAVVELGTLKANEIYQKPLSEFYNLFDEPLSKNNIVKGAPPFSISQMQEVWLKGGYPEPILSNDNGFYYQWMENYRNTYINRDIAKLFPRLNKLAYRRFLNIIAKLSGTIINKANLARAIEVSEKTAKEYLEIAEGTFLWRSLPSYEKNIIKAVVKMPKGYIRDSGLLHFLLRIDGFENLYNHPVVGSSFEGFVIEEILKGLESTMQTNWQACYYRTRDGAEVDLVLEGHFGILPIEIKQGVAWSRRSLKTLSAFIEEHNLAFGMLINQSSEAEWLTEKIVQIPVGWL